ncbi:MAG TPA: cell envelope integrity protein TolA [Gammaproteobacteria bacterium]|nr:cell envelope integrity protein TolA [Gammaproteobacteria bacterium]
MSAKPSKQSFFRRHSRATVLSVGFHVALVVALTVGVRFAREPRAPAPSTETIAIEATVVDESLIEREMARIEEQEQAEILRRQEEEQRAREQAEAAQRELEEQQRQLEAARQEQALREREAETERQRLADLQRQADAEEQRRVEAERQRVAEEQRLAQQREEEARRQREEEARRQREEQDRLAREAEAARQRALMEAELQRAMAAEEERRRAEAAGLLDQYVRLIEDRIERNWIRPASAGPGLRCEVNVTQIPSGDVIDVRVGRCNGDDAVVRSIEAAVLRASPLPQPPTPSLFSRNLIVNFQPDA